MEICCRQNDDEFRFLLQDRHTPESRRELKEYCMIGHPKCIVPDYQPSLHVEDSSENSSREEFQEEEGDNQLLESFQMGEGYDDSSDNPSPNAANHQLQDEINLFFSETEDEEKVVVEEGEGGEEEEMDRCEDEESSGTTLSEDFLNSVNNSYSNKNGNFQQGIYWRQERPQSPEKLKEETIISLFAAKETTSILRAMQQHMTAAESPKSSPNHRAKLTPNTTAAASSSHYESRDDAPESRRSGTIIFGKDDSVQRKAKAKHKRKLQMIEHRVLELIENSVPASADQPKMIMLDMLPKLYEMKHGEKLPLDPQANGILTLKAILRDIPSVKIVKCSPYFGIEHEYISYSTNTNIQSILSADTQEDEGVSVSSEESSANREVYAFFNQRTPRHTNQKDNYQGSGIIQKNKESKTSVTVPDIVSKSVREEDSHSVSNSTISSCGSSKSLVKALVGMLPNTNAFSDILRVLSKYPEGATIGQLLQEAPEYNNFLKHCTDRRCEAQIKLAHNVLQQCEYISYSRSSNKTILYFSNSEKFIKKKTLTINTKLKPKVSLPPATESTAETASLGNPSERAPNFSSVVKSSGAMISSRNNTVDITNSVTPCPELSRKNVTSSTDSVMNGPNSNAGSTVEFTSTEEKTAALFDASQFVASTGSLTSSVNNSNKHADSVMTGPAPLPGPFAFHRPPRNPSSELRTPTGSRSSSPLSHYFAISPHTPPAHSGTKPSSPLLQTLLRVSPLPSPRAPLSSPSTQHKMQNTPLSSPREVEIAETASRMLAEARSMTSSGPSPSPRVSPRITETRSDSMPRILAESLSTSSFRVGKTNTEGASVTEMLTEARSRSSPGANADRTDHSSSQPPSMPCAQQKETLKPTGGDTQKRNISQYISRHTDSQGQNLNYRSAKGHYFFTDDMPTSPSGDNIDFLEHTTSSLTKDETPLQQLRPTQTRTPSGGFLFNPSSPTISKSKPETSSTKETYEPAHDVTSVTSDVTELSTISALFSYQEQLALELVFEGSVISAMVCFLHEIKKASIGRSWPNSRLQLHQLSRRILDRGLVVSFISWFENTTEGTARTQNRKIEHALDALLKQLQMFKCLWFDSQRNFCIVWDRSTVDIILDCVKDIWKPNKQILDHDNINIEYVWSMDRLTRAVQTASFLKKPPTNEAVSVSFVGTLRELHFIAIRTDAETYLFDCVKIGTQAIVAALSAFFLDEHVVKVFYDLHHIAFALNDMGGVVKPMKGVFDIQLVMESLLGDPCISLEDAAHQLGIASNKSPQNTVHLFGKRQLAEPDVSYALEQNALLRKIQLSLLNMLQTDEASQRLFKSIQQASAERATSAASRYGSRRLCHDAAHGKSMVSLELLRVQRPSDIITDNSRAGIILDLLYANPTKSILFCGETGSSKSELLCAAAQILANQVKVAVVDRDELHMHGQKVDRRVPSMPIESLGDIMTRCARKDKPSIMVVHELERANDVEAAIICQRRSIRLLASITAGSLRELVDDRYISDLVVSSDKDQKPVFDMVVELRRGSLDEVRVITNSARAVEEIQQGLSYSVQLRSRDEKTGEILLCFEEA